MELDEGSLFVSLGHSRSKHWIYRYTQHTVMLSSQSRIYSFSDLSITGWSTESTVYRYCWNLLSYLLGYRNCCHSYQGLTLAEDLCQTFWQNGIVMRALFMIITDSLYDYLVIRHKWVKMICSCPQMEMWGVPNPNLSAENRDASAFLKVVFLLFNIW